MPALWSIGVQSLHGLCAAAAAVLAAVLVSRGGAATPVTRASVGGLVLTGGWALAAAMAGPARPAPAVLLSGANLAWLWLLYRLFAQDERDRTIGAIRPVVLALAFVALMQLALVPAAAGNPAAHHVIERFAVLFSLLFCVGGLVLVHSLYAGAANEAREILRWPAGALAGMWLYDLNLATLGYLTGRRSDALLELRGAAMLPILALLAIGMARRPGARGFQPSRQVALPSVALLAIGGYLMVMTVAVDGLSSAGAGWGRVAQIGFAGAAASGALVLVVSARARGWTRVMLSKHLFQHRYDYRAEWLRFTATIGRAGAAAAPLHERVVQSVADITGSPAGLLLTAREDGALELSARWQWPGAQIPAEALAAAGARFFEASEFILDIDELRAQHPQGIPTAAAPAWLIDQPEAWALVPLIHYGRLVGLVVLARGPVTRRLDWEDFDLLRVVGRQLASYLAEQASHDALAEAQRFDEFNRRIAFVMHDIKNLASQLALLARNAEKHADNPAFRADMLLTLRNSTDKLEGLLARLGRYGAHAEPSGPVDANALLAAVAERYAKGHEVLALERPRCDVLADRESLEQALDHLVHNAIEASPPGAAVLLDLRAEDASAVIEVIDSGAGMSPEFIRTRLFKPFHSSKPGGFGIGAFEARELIRAMGGSLEVESREGLGTRFLLRLPLPSATQFINSLNPSASEVA